MTREEYISGDEDSDEEESAEVAAIAITSSSSPSLFESPNEDAPTTSATCLMAKATEVISSSTPKTINDMHDHIGLRIKEENVALDRFMSNLKGEAKSRFESLLRDFGMAQDLLEEKGRLEREYASDIAALTSALEEEQEHRASLEERLESLDETNDEIIAKIIKDKELFIAKYKVMKKEKAEFVAANVRLQGEFEKLEKAHKALES